MNVVPHNECVCDACMIKYYREGLIPEGTSAYEEVMELMKKPRETKIISGFPGVGKSFSTKRDHLIALDSDSSHFSWIRKGERHRDFPNNYMQHIVDNIGKVDYIFVSSHDVVREALNNYGIPYTVVYPAVELKDEYIERYRNRGNDEDFIAFIGANWTKFIEAMKKETHPKLVELPSGCYLRDVLEFL